MFKAATPPKLPPIQHTKPEVFILESLNEADEKAKRYEGQILADMLRLSGKNPKYFYFQSWDEVPYLALLFRQSKYRYLHFSSHASATQIGSTEGGISYSKFAELFEGHLKLRRLFFSACQVGNQQFVDAVSAKNNGMHSIVAPAENIRFDHSAAIWATFYISMFTENVKAMKHAEIEKRLKALRTLFPVNFFLATYNSTRNDWTSKCIDGAAN